MAQNKVIVANWKMNPASVGEAVKLFAAIQRTAKDLRRTQAIVCSPSIFLQALSKRLKTAKCVLGAQNVFWEPDGAFTGETSLPQLERFDVGFVIVGHSERRSLGETDDVVAKKVRACLVRNFTPILCIGERVRDVDGDYLSFVRGELVKSLEGISAERLSRIVIAYEPVWAVGPEAKAADTPHAFFEMSVFIRKTLVDMFGRKHKTMIMGIPILYGGSVDEDNAEGFLKEGNAAGLLVGRASLDAKQFSLILKIAERIRS
ncbi:MAG: triosephosphate isomerase [Parcubacteria group bacterium]|nr:triosephosphate isomerase [Parcubacteria group bacterium]